MARLGPRSTAQYFCIAVLCALHYSAAPASGAVVYRVTVDTGTINGTAGNLDFQFNPGGPSSQAAFAEISGFTSFGGALSGVPVVLGTGVNGTLPGTVTIANTSGLNDYFHAFTFGMGLQFTLKIDGDAIQAPNGVATAGSSFGLALFDALGLNFFLTTDPNGFVGIANVELNGSVTTATFPSTQGGGAPAVTFALVPEPSSFFLIGGALSALGLSRFRGRAKG